MKDPLVGIAKFRSELLFCPEPSPPAAFPILLVGNSILPLLLNQNIGIILDSCFFFFLLSPVSNLPGSLFTCTYKIYTVFCHFLFFYSRHPDLCHHYLLTGLPKRHTEQISYFLLLSTAIYSQNNYHSDWCL